MRVFAILLLTLPLCMAQSDESKVEAVLRQLERAEQSGDFNAYAVLWTREKSAEIEKMRQYARPRPDVHYRAMRSFARGDDAVLLVEGGPNSFLTMKLRRESGDWKIQEEVFRNTAADPNSVYALLPPGPGAFARAGSRWDQVAAGVDARDAARLGYQVKTVFDESYLYIRIESNTELPAPGSTTGKSPANWPHMRINASDAGEFVLFDSVNIGDQATFDQSGKANSHRPYAAYMIRLERKDREIFSASADLNPNPLLDVKGRDYEIRIPLSAMGITDSRATRLTVGDAQWPKSVFFSIAAQRYPR